MVRTAHAACMQQHKGSGRAWKDGGMMTGLGVSDTLLPPCMSCSRCDAGAGELDAPSTWKPTTFRRGVGLLPMLLRCRLRSMPQHASRLSQLVRWLAGLASPSAASDCAEEDLAALQTRDCLVDGGQIAAWLGIGAWATRGCTGLPAMQRWIGDAFQTAASVPASSEVARGPVRHGLA